MPIGSQSLQPFTPTVYTSMVASQYKADLDGNSSVVSNPSGMFYVYPNSPAALSVLIDTGFNYPSIGTTPFAIFNGSGGPVTQTVTAPGSNSYYATVYWDTLANTSGVVYGATSVTPNPILPEKNWQVPLACVLIANGQSTISASNIFDVRNFFAPRGTVAFSNTSATTPVTVNCLYAANVSIYIAFSAAASFALSLFNLQLGVPVSIVVTNNSASSETLTILATSPIGTSYTVRTKSSASVVTWSSGAAVGAGTTVMLNMCSTTAYTLQGPGN